MPISGLPGASRGPSSWDGRDRLAALVFFLIACALLFPNLGDRRLWQDEAETALVAVNILRTGWPLGWDGRLLVTQMSGAELTDSFLWAWTPWLMHYVAALGMAVAGENSFGARWLFALLGCVSFPFFYRLVRGSRGRGFALFVTAWLLTSVQYLLLMRQSRYYALLPVTFFLALTGYGRLPSRAGVALLGVGLLLLFHSNYAACALAVAGLLVHAAMFRRADGIWGGLGLCGLLLAAGSLPWVLALGVSGRVAGSGGSAANFLGTLIMSNRAVYPWLLLLVLLAVRLRRGRPERGTVELCACLLVPMFLLLPAFLWPNPRYVTHLLPLGILLQAEAVRELHAWKPWLGVALAALLVGSNALIVPLPALLPSTLGRELFAGELETGADAVALGPVKTELREYVHELTHSVRGPDEELVAFVKANTAPDDVIVVSNDGLSVMFHTRRPLGAVATPQVRQRPGWEGLPAYLWDVRRARWLILRPQHPFGHDATARASLLDALRRAGVTVDRTLRLDIHDTQWINRPLLAKHVFRTPAGPPNGVDVLRLVPSPR